MFSTVITSRRALGHTQPSTSATRCGSRAANCWPHVGLRFFGNVQTLQYPAGCSPNCSCLFWECFLLRRASCRGLRIGPAFSRRAAVLGVAILDSYSALIHLYMAVGSRSGQSDQSKCWNSGLLLSNSARSILIRVAISLRLNVDGITALALRIAGEHLRSCFFIDGPANDLTLHRGTLDWGHFSGAAACPVKLGT